MGLWQSTQDNSMDSHEEDHPTMNVYAEALVNPRQLRNPYVTVLKEILEVKAQLDKKLIKENNEILHTFLNTFIEEMKRNDETFNVLYNRNVYMGSFYSNMRVSKPDEFDLNLVLKFPSRFKVKGSYHPQAPSFMTFKLDNENILSDYPKMRKFFKDGFLIPGEIRKWLQSVIDKTLPTYRCPSRFVRNITKGASGPARTVYIMKTNGEKIDIDLVPVFEYVPSESPPGIDGRVKAKVNISQCFLVPKPFDKNGQAPINDTVIACLWRAHYPKAESDFLSDFQCINSVVKLLKLLRDKYGWKSLASYYLKTIVMWMLLENYDREYWKEDKLGDRYLEALNRLRDCVNRREIKYFFSSRYNLIRKLQQIEAINMYNGLSRIIRIINNDPDNLWALYACKPTFYLQ